MSEIQELLHRMGRVEEALGDQTRSLDRLTGRLEAQCPANERRITQNEARLATAEQRIRNGNSSSAGPSNGSMSGRAILAVSGAITALATTLATIIARIWGGN